MPVRKRRTKSKRKPTKRRVSKSSLSFYPQKKKSHFKQGFFKPRHPEKYKGDLNNIVYRSGWEKCAFHWVDNNCDIIEWSSESIVIPYFYSVDQKVHRYFPDLWLKYKDQSQYIVEIKPKSALNKPIQKKLTIKESKSVALYIRNTEKWDAAEQYAAENCSQFVIWTEDELKKLQILQ